MELPAAQRLRPTTGTSLLFDINTMAGESSYPTFLTAVKEKLFFAANDGVHGVELWQCDGTTAKIVKDINNVSSSVPRNLVDVSGTLFFTVDDGFSGNELWKSDGTHTGTRLFKDIWPGSDSSNPYSLTFFDGTLFFSARDNIHGIEPWMYRLPDFSWTMFLPAITGGGR